jgi:hypothetical protein
MINDNLKNETDSTPNRHVAQSQVPETTTARFTYFS